VKVPEARNSLLQRFLVRVCAHFTGSLSERKPENPGEPHSGDFRAALVIEKPWPAQLP
jgi:hypothetical protein